MIVCFTGKPGAGKTSVAVYKVWKWAKKEGLVVFSNMNTLKYPDVEVRYISVKDLPRIRRGIVLLDEANYIFNSRFWDRIDADIIRHWQMHRKRTIDIVLTSHSLKRIDKILRELVQYEYRVRKGMFGFWVYSYDLDIEDSKPLVMYYPRWVIKRAWSWFDTHEEIEVLDASAGGGFPAVLGGGPQR
jgi:hypothetical protein